MRVDIAVSPRADKRGWDVVLRFAERELRHRMERAAPPLPVLATDDNVPDPDQPHAPLHGDEALRRSVAERLGGPRQGACDATLVGRHLFDALIGQRAWSEIVEAAQMADAPLLELALAWNAADALLHAPKWELMHDGSQFLATFESVPVAITHVVKDAAPRQLESIQAPARVLFVIGDINDPEIRVGAEIMGLLRRVGQHGGINASILESPTVEALAHEVKRFDPDVVHLVTHGRIEDGDGRVQLSGVDDESPLFVPSRTLRDALRRRNGTLPPIAVITACGSAGSDGHTASLAAELVRAGVTIVVGMTGNVSDPVCRLFSHCFGEALTGGLPLLEALTQGRRAALWKNGLPDGRIDWALPALFRGPYVPSDYAPVDARHARTLSKRMAAFELAESPVFCGRDTFMRLFRDLVDADAPLNVLVAWVDRTPPKLGKTRLLHELARQAIREGHVVVMVSARQTGTAAEPPTTPERFARAVLQEILASRETYGLPIPPTSAIVSEMAIASGDDLARHVPPGGDHASDQMRYVGKWEGTIELETLRRAIARDLIQLAEDARAVEDPSFGAHSRVVVFLENVERWAETTPALASSLLRSSGLGSVTETVPVVMSCTMDDAHDDTLTGMKDSGESGRWMRFEQLKAFCAPEDALAYQWVLLNPQPNVYPEVSGSVYTGSPTSGWEHKFREHVGGAPEVFKSKLFYVVADLLLEARKLVADDDDDAKLRAYLDHLQDAVAQP